MKLVVDTSVLIDHLRGGKHSTVIFDRIEKQNAELFIPTIVIFELFSGKSAQDKSTAHKITELIYDFKRIDLREEIAILAGELNRKIGKHISPQDYIVAGSALLIGGTVLTLNIKHFEQIPHLVLYPL